MTRTGPKGPPLFDVLASRRREPSALELALQAASAQRLVDTAAGSTEPVTSDAARAGTEVEAAPPDRGGPAAARQLWAVALDDEPPLTAGAATSAWSGDTGAGPRIAAFAAATGAAVRRPTPPVDASVPTPDGSQAGQQEGIAPTPGDPDVTRAATWRAASQVVEQSGGGAGDGDGGAPAGESAQASPTPPHPAAVPSRAAEQPTPNAAAHSVAGVETVAGVEPHGAVGVATGDSVPEVDEDDFGPLLVPDEPRRGRRPRRPNSAGASEVSPATRTGPSDVGGGSVSSRRMGRRAGIALGACALTLLGLAAWRWIPSDTPAPATGTVAQAPTVDGPDVAAGRQPVGDVSMVPWHGIALPVSASAGPRVQGATASGFEHSALGAAIAAASLVVRVDPQAGASVYEPTLATQVVGDAERLSRAVRDQAGTASDGGGPPGTLTGWRIAGDPTGDRVAVHLAVDPGAAPGLDFAVPLAWVAGDWRIDAPATGPFFPSSDLSGDYTPFVQEGSAS